LSIRIPRTSDIYKQCPTPPKVIKAKRKTEEYKRSVKATIDGIPLWRSLDDDNSTTIMMPLSGSRGRSVYTPCQISVHYDSSIIAINSDDSYKGNTSPYNGGEIWMRPTPEYIANEVKSARANVKGGASPRKHKRPPKPDQQRKQQQESWTRANDAEQELRQKHSNPLLPTVKYTLIMKQFMSLMDGRWLASYGNTIYWLPIHDYHRMKRAGEHYFELTNVRSSKQMESDALLKCKKDIEGYADVFARIPNEDAVIVSMYPLDGNMYGIGSDLFITLVRILPSEINSKSHRYTFMRRYMRGQWPPSGVNDGTQWQWMIWSISSSSLSTVGTATPTTTSSSTATTMTSATIVPPTLSLNIGENKRNTPSSPSPSQLHQEGEKIRSLSMSRVGTMKDDKTSTLLTNNNTTNDNSDNNGCIPISIWTLPDTTRYRSRPKHGKEDEAHEMRPLCIDAAPVLANAFARLPPPSPPNHQSANLPNANDERHRDQSRYLHVQPTIETLSKEDQSVLRFIVLPTPAYTARPPPPPPPPIRQHQEDDDVTDCGFNLFD
jgi:hypothetical protein